MKVLKKIIFLITPFILVSCSMHKIEEVNLEENIKTINKVIDRWHRDAGDGNHEAYIGTMNAHGIFIGTDASENWSTKEFKEWSKPYFDKGKSWAFTSLERNVYFSNNGKIAWFDELLNTKMGVCRGSGILEKINEDWKINHYVLSLTVPNENLKKVIEINQEKDSIIIDSYLQKAKL